MAPTSRLYYLIYAICVSMPNTYLLHRVLQPGARPTRVAGLVTALQTYMKHGVGGVAFIIKIGRENKPRATSAFPNPEGVFRRQILTVSLGCHRRHIHPDHQQKAKRGPLLTAGDICRTGTGCASQVKRSDERPDAPWLARPPIDLPLLPASQRL